MSAPVFEPVVAARYRSEQKAGFAPYAFWAGPMILFVAFWLWGGELVAEMVVGDG